MSKFMRANGNCKYFLFLLQVHRTALRRHSRFPFKEQLALLPRFDQLQLFFTQFLELSERRVVDQAGDLQEAPLCEFQLLPF